MVLSVPLKKVDFYTPSFFHIEVKGILDDTLSDVLGGMQVVHHKKMGVDVTSLEGKIVDQAALLGVLNALYDMRYPIIRIEMI